MPASFRPYARLRPLTHHHVRWLNGFWGAWTQVCREVMVPNMWRLLADNEISHAWANFRIAAGLEAGQHRGPKWHDGDFYKWLEAAANVYAAAPDPDLDRLMDEAIAVIVQAQRADGYIHTPVIIAARGQGGEAAGADPARAFHERLHFETYNMGHLMTAACAHSAATGKTALLDAARRAAGFLESYYEQAAPELARNAICPSHYMGVVDLYRTTGEPRWLALAQALIEIRELVQGGDDNQDRLPLRAQAQMHGHAVRANYLYAGAADVYAETGDPTLLAPLEALWRDLVTHKLYVTGGCGALYDGASPDGSPHQEAITRVHQAYGRAYQLPNLTAHSETCANIGLLLWGWRMLTITGEARYADVLELALYNSVLSGISLDGRRFFYTNPLRKVDGLPFELRWSKTREEYIDCFCCPPNVVRTIAQVGQYFYSQSDDGVWVHLYGNSTAEFALPGGETLRLRQETDYPFSGEVVLQVEEAPVSEFTLRLRIPGWVGEYRRVGVSACRRDGVPEDRSQEVADAATADVETVGGDALVPGSYYPMTRRWKAGDRVTLSLDMPAEWIEAHPLVEETRNHLALRRGPLVYCLESVDLPPGVRVIDVYADPGQAFTPAEDEALGRLLPGLRVLRGKGWWDSSGGAWQGQLYRPARPKAFQEIDLTLVPYFAWDNRGPSEMTVWLPARG